MPRLAAPAEGNQSAEEWFVIVPEPGKGSAGDHRETILNEGDDAGSREAIFDSTVPEP
jgi:hypothetical protein